MISDKLKFVFIHIPKTGGSSVSYFLKNVSNEEIGMTDSRVGKGKGVFVNENGKNVKHLTLYEILKDEGSKYGDYYKFTIVRNPYDRTMSYYFWNRGIKKTGFDKEDFIRFVSKLNDYQVSYVSDPKTGKLLTNKIVKYENMISELNTISCLKRFNFSNLPRLNVSQNNKKFYDQELKDLVYDKFKIDFKTFGYSK